MNDIFDLFWEPTISENGRFFLSDRDLSIQTSLENGIRADDEFIYFFYSLHYKPVGWKKRSMSDKKIQFTGYSEEFRLEHGKLKNPSDKFDKNPPMPFFSQFETSSCDYLIITEGEFDCIALKQLGASNCVSLPFGSGSVGSSFRNNFHYLQKFDKIYIAFDCDESGDKAAEEALKFLGPSKYRRIIFPEKCKDANEWVKKCSPCKEDIESLLLNAVSVKSASITNMLDLPDSYYDEIDLGISSKFKSLDMYLGGLRTGEVTVICGDTGSGKTTFCMNLMKNIAGSKKGIWINSYELFPKVVNRKFASVVLKKNYKYQKFPQEDLKKYKQFLFENNCHINEINAPITFETLKKDLEIATLCHDVKYVLLDHFDYVYSTGKKKTALENIDDAMRQLHIFAMQFDIGIFLVVHPKQVPSGTELTMNDLKGSSAIKQYADNILIITRKDRIDQNEKDKVRIRICKNRLCGTEGYFEMLYIKEGDTYEEFKI